MCCTGPACGYSLAGHGSFPARICPDVRRPDVCQPHGRLQPRDDADAEGAVGFIGRGKFQILPEATGVDALLSGEVVAVNIQPASFTPNQLASRYAITMVAKIELRDMRENKVLWENPSVTFRQDDATGGRAVIDPAAFFQQDTNALERLSTEFARTIVSAILEAF